MLRHGYAFFSVRLPPLTFIFASSNYPFIVMFSIKVRDLHCVCETGEGAGRREGRGMRGWEGRREVGGRETSVCGGRFSATQLFFNTFISNTDGKAILLWNLFLTCGVPSPLLVGTISSLVSHYL